MTIRPTRLQFAGGSTAFVHLPHAEVMRRINIAKSQGRADLNLDGRRVVLERLVAVVPPASRQEAA